VADVAVSVLETKITRRPGKAGALIFGCVLGAGALYLAWRLAADLSHGTMAANSAGLRWSTIPNILTAWLLTLPASIALSAGLFWLFRTLSES
jgi:phosphate/sulfate permease